jgi:hypothetical protein
MAFRPWTPQGEVPRRSPKIVPIWTPATLRGYNSLFKPLIVMMFEANF